MTAGGCLVLGVGNLLLQDEGIGIHVVRELSRDGAGLPADTQVVDGGTLGLDLLPLLDGVDGVVFVDAAELHREPGAVAVLRGEEIAAATGGHLSVHQVGLADLLAVARINGTLPARVALVAVQPGVIAPGLELTPEVAAALPAAVAAARAEARAMSGS